MIDRRIPVRITCGFFAFSCVFLGACSNLAYYGQAVNGELKILGERRPLKAVIRDPSTSPAVREKLELVEAARRYAVTALGLPKGGSYRSYVALDRTYPVWVVYAAPELSLIPLHWCFPFAGCVPYRGYFHEKAARAFAAGLAKRGDDVFVTGAPAYSTLGWFSDPVYSSMLRWGEAELAGTVFHELAHQKLYVENDSAFNESFADTVEDVGVERFFAARDPRVLAAWRMQRRAGRAMGPYVREARASLLVIYDSKAGGARKREEKKAEFRWLAERYREVGARYGVRYSSDWLARLNNASLALTNTYDRWVPAFRRLLACLHGDLPVFYRAAARIGALAPKVRVARLETLAASGKSGADACKPYRASSSGVAAQGG